MKKKKSLSLWKGFLLTFFMAISLSAFSQNITVKGTVTDDTGLTVIGGTVIVEGNSDIGTVTDIDGNYT